MKIATNCEYHKLWYVHTMGYLVNNQKEKNYWMYLKNIMLSKKSQTQKSICCMIPCIRSSRIAKLFYGDRNLNGSCLWKQGDQGFAGKEMRELSRMMEIFYILIGVLLRDCIISQNSLNCKIHAFYCM